MWYHISLAFAQLIVLGSALNSSQELIFTRLPGSDGLCSPRKMTIQEGNIYIAEAGFGPKEKPLTPNETDTCVSIRGSYHCIGSTARVSMLPLAGGNMSTVMDGLFSSGPVVAGETNEDSDVTGVHSVAFDSEGTMYAVTGLGLNGTSLQALGVDVEYGAFGVILKGTDGEVVAEPWKSEFEFNYDGSSDPTGVLPVPDSNPYHILITGSKFHVVCVILASASLALSPKALTQAVFSCFGTIKYRLMPGAIALCLMIPWGI